MYNHIENDLNMILYYIFWDILRASWPGPHGQGPHGQGLMAKGLMDKGLMAKGLMARVSWPGPHGQGPHGQGAQQLKTKFPRRINLSVANDSFSRPGNRGGPFVVTALRD